MEDQIEAFPTPPASAANDPFVTSNGQNHRDFNPQSFKLESAPPQQDIASIPSPALPGPAKKFDLLDIELIQHYCTRTYLTISSRLETHVIWRDTVFKEASHHEWLLNGIMATAALHKASMLPESSEDYAKVALAHQNAALNGYIPEVSRPNQDNSIAIFSLSLLLTIWAFASKDLPEGLKMVGATSTPGDGNLDVRVPRTFGLKVTSFAQIITVLRGIYTIILETNTWLQGQPIEELLRYPREGDLPPHSPDLAEAYDILAEAVKSFEDSDDFKDMCVDQVTRLRSISRCRSVVEWDGHIFSFFIMAPVTFINGIKQGNSLALAILAYWAACFRCMDHHWWANGWPQTLVHDISNLLDMQVWGKAMEWPRRQCGLLFQDGVSYESRRAP